MDYDIMCRFNESIEAHSPNKKVEINATRNFFLFSFRSLIYLWFRNIKTVNDMNSHFGELNKANREKEKESQGCYEAYYKRKCLF